MNMEHVHPTDLFSEEEAEILIWQHKFGGRSEFSSLPARGHSLLVARKGPYCARRHLSPLETIIDFT
jgi:hypothetical protein